MHFSVCSRVTISYYYSSQCGKCIAKIKYHVCREWVTGTISGVLGMVFDWVYHIPTCNTYYMWEGLMFPFAHGWNLLVDFPASHVWSLIIGWYLIQFLLGSGKSWIYIPAIYGGFLWMFPQKSSLGYVRWNRLRNVKIGFWVMILLDFVCGICWEISRDCIFRRCHNTLMTNYDDRSIDHRQTNR